MVSTANDREVIMLGRDYEKQKQYRNKWDKANMTVLGCKVLTSEAERFKTACKERGTTPNAVFKQAIHDFLSASDQATAQDRPERDTSST